MSRRDQSSAVDEIDDIGAAYSAVVLDAEGHEREPWKLFGATCSRSLVVVLIVTLLVSCFVAFACYRLSTGIVSCEESTIYCMLISSTFAYILPSPIRQ